MSQNYKGPVHLRDKRYDRVIVVNTTFSEPSMTDQSFLEECDINMMMAKYQATGELPVNNPIPPQWIDVTEQDFTDHMNMVVEAQNLFDQLPAIVRDRFANDPGALLGFISDESNRAEAVKMGLLSEEATARFNAPPASPQPAPSTPPDATVI